MSRLDYVTVAIVGICILAIVFLVYKMTNVFNSDKPKDTTEITTDSVETEDDGAYDYEIDQNVDSTGTASGNASTDNTTKTKPATSKEQSISDAPAEDDTESGSKTSTPSTSKPSATTGTSTSDESESATSSEGKYMVLAGSFTKKALADAQLKKLDKMGYDNARVELFDRGKYAVVLVDRFTNMADAERTVKKLSGDGVKSYVKVKS